MCARMCTGKVRGHGIDTHALWFSGVPTRRIMRRHVAHVTWTTRSHQGHSGAPGNQFVLMVDLALEIGQQQVFDQQLLALVTKVHYWGCNSKVMIEGGSTTSTVEAIKRTS